MSSEPERFGATHILEPRPLPDCPGIYFLCKRAEIVYVGKTGSIAQRVPNHRGIKDFDSVLVLRAPKELLNSVEIYSIKRLRPKLNHAFGGAGRRKTSKISVTIRLSPETRMLLDRAAEQFDLDSVSLYVEEAIRQRLKRDKILL